MTALELARFFHDTYERLAPDFGYETRQDTREFSPASKNGQLMVAVCAEVLTRLGAWSAASQPSAAPDPSRCYACGWPLAPSRDEGCVPGDCSYRPSPAAPDYWQWRRRMEEMQRAANNGSQPSDEHRPLCVHGRFRTDCPPCRDKRAADNGSAAPQSTAYCRYCGVPDGDGHNAACVALVGKR